MPRRLLLADHDPSVRTALARALSAGGHAVRSVDSGEGALELLRRETYDVLLLDIRLPGIDGVDTMRAVRVVAPGLPVILMTGSDGDPITREAQRHGAPVLLKPFDLSKILELLDTVLVG